MSRAFYHVAADPYLLSLATANHLLLEVPQMNADPAMSSAVYHVRYLAADHYSVWILQTTSSVVHPR